MVIRWNQLAFSGPDKGGADGAAVPGPPRCVLGPAIEFSRVRFGFLRSTRFHNQASSRSMANSDCKFTISLENGNDLCVYMLHSKIVKSLNVLGN